jgi:signal transduction histidine kinase
MDETAPLPVSALPPDQIERFEKLLAQELHDTVCQGLAGTTFLVNVLRRQAEAGQAVQPGDLQKVAAFLERTMDDLRAIISPDSLTGDGFVPALEKFAREVSQNVPCHVLAQAARGPTDPRTALVLYRLARWTVRRAATSIDSIFIELARADDRFTMEIHGGAPTAFGKFSGIESDFLRHYAQTARIDLSIDPAGSRLRFQAPAG